jgi:hypothetical protein
MQNLNLHALTGSDIELIIRGIPMLEDTFYGVHGYQFLSDVNCLPIRKAVILNTMSKEDSTDSPSMIGHWLVVFRVSLHKFELLDPLGFKSPKFADYPNYFASFGKLKLNRTPIQSDFSETCGHICLYYLINRSMDYRSNFGPFLDALFPEKFDDTDNFLAAFFEPQLSNLAK